MFYLSIIFPALNTVEVSDAVRQSHGVIALIDTGVNEHANVTCRVSVIDDVLTGNGHGDDMAAAIVSQDADAKILSIRAMGDDGCGTVSALVAAMEYAISQKVDIINLSLYAKTTLSTSVLKREIQKATDSGIIVVGAAGNDGADVKTYVPGSVKEAYIIGAAGKSGCRLAFSNYGDTVDYNVAATSTSEAAALFTGFISANGIDKVSTVLNQGLIYATDYEKTVIGDNKADFSDGRAVMCVCDNGDVKVTVIDAETGDYHVYHVSGKDVIFVPEKDSVHIDVCTMDEMYSMQHVDAADADGNVLAEPEVLQILAAPEMPVNVRNAFFNVSGKTLSQLNIKTEKNEYWIPVFDEIANNVYYESMLCGDNCLNEHIRRWVKDSSNDDKFHTAYDAQHEFTCKHGAHAVDQCNSKLSWNSDAIEVDCGADPLSDVTAEVGDVYTGDCNFELNGTHWQDNTNFTMTFTSGVLNTDGASTISFFECQNLHWQNPGIGGLKPEWAADDTGRYEACLVDESNNSYTFEVMCYPTNHDAGLTIQRTGALLVLSYTPPNGGLSIQKESANPSITDGNDNYSLEHAIYVVYSDYECTDVVKAITTNERGYATTADDALPAGTYYVKEYMPSKGYALDETVYTFEVVAGRRACFNWQTSKEPPKTCSINITKRSELPDITDGNDCYSLQGAVYTVYSDAACTSSTGMTITTDENGEGSCTGLPPGMYWVKETSASSGFGMDTNVYEANCNEGDSDVTTVNIESIEPPLNDPAGIQITKIWNGEVTDTLPSLEGTEFTIDYYDSMTITRDDIEYGAVTPQRTWVIATKELDGKYMASLLDMFKVGGDEFYKDGEGFVILPLGAYTVRETKPAPGYTLDGSGYMTDKDGNDVSTDTDFYFTRLEDVGDDLRLSGGNEYTGYNSTYPITIKMIKYDSDGTPLSDVQYEIMDEYGNPVMDKDGNEIGVQTTDADGVVEFYNLYPNVYQIKEIKTQPGMQLLKEPVMVSAPMRMSWDEAISNNLDTSDTSRVIWSDAEDCYLILSQTFEVTDHPVFTMPMAGSTVSVWTFVPLMLGLAIFTGVSAVIICKKKKIVER